MKPTQNQIYNAITTKLEAMQLRDGGHKPIEISHFQMKKELVDFRTKQLQDEPEAIKHLVTVGALIFEAIENHGSEELLNEMIKEAVA